MMSREGCCCICLGHAAPTHRLFAEPDGELKRAVRGHQRETISSSGHDLAQEQPFCPQMFSSSSRNQHQIRSSPPPPLGPMYVEYEKARMTNLTASQDGSLQQPNMDSKTISPSFFSLTHGHRNPMKPPNCINPDR